MNEPEAPWSYDLIADIYDTDMGSNLPYDDVAFYADICRRRRGKVLELGCGTGRVQLSLIAQGLEVVGVDRSAPMLARLRHDAAERGLSAPVALADARRLPFDDQFEVVIAPFSMIVYAVEVEDVRLVFEAACSALKPNGLLVVDAFIPKDVSVFQEFRRDYRRPYGTGWLERLRRISELGDGVNRVDRLYRLTEAQGYREWETTEIIRPYRSIELQKVGRDCGVELLQSVIDYGQTGQAPSFETVIFRKPGLLP